jgi:hypothetical protein
MSGKIDGDGFDLQLPLELNGQSCPRIEVSAGLVQQQRYIRASTPAEPSDDWSPGETLLDCLGVSC